MEKWCQAPLFHRLGGLFESKDIESFAAGVEIAADDGPGWDAVVGEEGGERVHQVAMDGSLEFAGAILGAGAVFEQKPAGAAWICRKKRRSPRRREM